MTIAGYNYTRIHSCDDLVDTDTACSNDATSNDTGDFKEGIASCYWTLNATGEQATFEPAAALDLSASPVRFWGLFSQGGLLENASDGGIQFWAADGANTGKWYLDGKDTYSGGWKNFVIDLGQTVDEGSQPSDSAITSLGVEVHLSAGAKNVPNTWIDHLWYGDGLLVSSDNAGSPYTLADIMAAENTPATGGWGVLTRFGGQYYCIGELRFAEANFQAKSSVLVFEDRPVSTDLMGITVVDSDGTSEFQLGARSGDAGIEGCVVRVADPAQTPKFFFEAGDSDLTRFGLYGTTLFDAEVVNLPDVNSTDVQVLNSSFETSGEVVINFTEVLNSNFISANSRGVRISDSDFNMEDCRIISCPIGIHYPNSGSYTADGLIFTGCSDDVEFSANGSDAALVINAADGANPNTYIVTGTADSDSVTINNPIFHTLTGVAEGSEVTYARTNETELYHVESSSTDGQVQYSYNYTSDIPFYITIYHLGYEPYLIDNQTLGSVDATVPVQQSTDPNYSNP